MARGKSGQHIPSVFLSQKKPIGTGHYPMKRQRATKTAIYLLIAGLIAIAASIGYVALLFFESTGQSERHDYHCSFSLSYSTTIRNVTILFPVPAIDGKTVFPESFLDRSMQGIPDGWALSIEEVNGTSMLAIRAAEMVPAYHGYPIAIEPGQSPLPGTLSPRNEYSPETPVLQPVHIGTMLPVNRTIDTLDPVGREPLFAPEGRFTGRRERERQNLRGTEYIHPVPVYVSFSSEHPVEFTLQATIQGTNSVWRGGWIFNSYQDMVLLEVHDSPGWTEAVGILCTGEGDYYS